MVSSRHYSRCMIHLGFVKPSFPLFWMASDGDLQGLGTAFAIDPWGGFMTADHVIADARAHGRTLRSSDGDFRVEMPSDAGLVAVLGHGLVFGTVGLPQEAIAHVGRTWSPVLPGTDPLATLQGRSDFQPIDLALLQTRSPASDHIQNLRMRSRPRGPRPGDVVVAVGYPQINTFRGDREDALTTIAEGMQVAFGRVNPVAPARSRLHDPDARL